MGKLLEECYPAIIRSVAEINGVSAMGKSGRSNLPEHGESDIDIYVFCNRIPEIKLRKEAIDRMGDVIAGVNYSEHGGKFWGTIDFLTVDDTDICLMYFATKDMGRRVL